jgi:hypothetical protein
MPMRQCALAFIQHRETETHNLGHKLDTTSAAIAGLQCNAQVDLTHDLFVGSTSWRQWKPRAGGAQIACLNAQLAQECVGSNRVVIPNLHNQCGIQSDIDATQVILQASQ